MSFTAPGSVIPTLIEFQAHRATLPPQVPELPQGSSAYPMTSVGFTAAVTAANAVENAYQSIRALVNTRYATLATVKAAISQNYQALRELAKTLPNGPGDANGIISTVLPPVPSLSAGESVWTRRMAIAAGVVNSMGWDDAFTPFSGYQADGIQQPASADAWITGAVTRLRTLWAEASSGLGQQRVEKQKRDKEFDKVRKMCLQYSNAIRARYAQDSVQVLSLPRYSPADTGATPQTGVVQFLSFEDGNAAELQLRVPSPGFDGFARALLYVSPVSDVVDPDDEILVATLYPGAFQDNDIPTGDKIAVYTDLANRVIPGTANVYRLRTVGIGGKEVLGPPLRVFRPLA